MSKLHTSLSGRRSRWGRWVLSALLALVLLALTVVGAAALLIRQLDSPRVKRAVREAAGSAGFDIDYGETQVRVLSGLRIGDLVVRSPERFRAEAPELLHLGTLEVEWSPGSLLKGRVRSVTARDLAVALVAAEDGSSSLSELGKKDTAPAPATQATPTSRILAELLKHRPPVDRIDLERAEATVVLHLPGKTERLHLGGLGVGLSVDRADDGWRLKSRGARRRSRCCSRSAGSGTARLRERPRRGST